MFVNTHNLDFEQFNTHIDKTGKKARKEKGWEIDVRSKLFYGIFL